MMGCGQELHRQKDTQVSKTGKRQGVEGGRHIKRLCFYRTDVCFSWRVNKNLLYAIKICDYQHKNT